MQLASFALWAVPVSINRSVFFGGFPCLQVTFSYSVKWSPTTITYDQRLQRYERFPLNPIHLEIHWFSIVNSCVTVLLLTGFLATILMRVLKADFVKFSREDGGWGLGTAGQRGGWCLHNWQLIRRWAGGSCRPSIQRGILVMLQ